MTATSSRAPRLSLAYAPRPRRGGRATRVAGRAAPAASVRPTYSPDEALLPTGLAPGEITVNQFAGGGGVDEGARAWTGIEFNICVNHDAQALRLHAANFPKAVRYQEDVWQVDPVAACAGRRVGAMWLSPDCKHFSKCKGAVPLSRRIRALAWVAIRWAAAVRPRTIFLENVQEFVGWSPVKRATQRPCPHEWGQTFRAFVRKLVRFGYTVEWRSLRACDFGAPTSRSAEVGRVSRQVSRSGVSGPRVVSRALPLAA